MPDRLRTLQILFGVAVSQAHSFVPSVQDLHCLCGHCFAGSSVLIDWVMLPVRRAAACTYVLNTLTTVFVSSELYVLTCVMPSFLVWTVQPMLNAAFWGHRACLIFADFFFCQPFTRSSCAIANIDHDPLSWIKIVAHCCRMRGRKTDSELSLIGKGTVHVIQAHYKANAWSILISYHVHWSTHVYNNGASGY